MIDDPANGYAGLNEDLWVRIFAQLPAEDLLVRCASVCRNWRSWVYSLSASRLSYKQDYTCRICNQQASCRQLSTLCPMPDLGRIGLQPVCLEKPDDAEYVILQDLANWLLRLQACLMKA